MVITLFRNSQKLLEKQHNNILSAAGVITTAVLISSILGFVRTRLLVSHFYDTQLMGLEPGAALDAYLVAFRIPDFVFQLMVIGALSAAFIPVYAQYQRDNEKEANRVVNSMVNIIGVLFLGIAAIIYWWAYPLNELLTGDNFSIAQLTLATTFTRVMLLSQLFFAVSSFMTGIIQANQRFLIPALSPVAYNLGIIFGILVLGPYMGLYGAAVGVIIGAFLHLILQVPLALKLGFRYQFVFDVFHPGVKKIGKLMLPRTLAISVDQVELFVIAFLATTLPDKGSYLIISLAQQLMKAPVRIFGVPIGQASLPFLSKQVSENRWDTFKSTLLNSLHQIFYLALPATAVLIVLRIPLVRILYGAKEFPWTATLLTGKMVAVMSLGIFAYATTQLLSRAFYAIHNTKTPFISAVLSMIVSISLCWSLVLYTNLGVMGIAVGTTVGAIFQATFLFVTLAHQLKWFDFQTLVLPLIKMSIASILTGILLWLLMRMLDAILDTTRTLNLVMLTIAATGVGGIVYLWLSKLLQIKELEAYLKLLNRIGNWQKVLSSSGESLDQASSDPLHT